MTLCGSHFLRLQKVAKYLSTSRRSQARNIRLCDSKFHFSYYEKNSQNGSLSLNHLTTYLDRCDPEPQCPVCNDFRLFMIFAPSIQSVTLTTTSAPAGVVPCGPSAPDPGAINFCSNSDYSFLSNPTSGGPEP